jgi:hypothetical protein
VSTPAPAETPAVLPWADLLAAYEERLRLFEDVARGRAAHVPPPIAARGDGPLPAELRLRAAVLLDRMQRLQPRLTRRRDRNVRAGLAYSAH